MKFPGFIGSAYKMSSLPISAQRCVNWYPEIIKNQGAATTYALQPTPGYAEITDLDDGSLPTGSFTRGIYRTSKGIGGEVTGSIITVVGDAVFWLQQDANSVYGYTPVRVGDVSNVSARVSMVDDGFGLIIADGVQLYRLNLETLAFTSVGFNLNNPTQVAFIGGYTIVIGTQDGLPQNTFFWSGLYDNSSWDALDYASAEQSQDPLTGCIVAGTYLYLFGPTSYELWTTTDDEDLPFQRSYAASGTIGLHAPLSLNKIGDSIFFIGSNNQGTPACYRSNGSQMIKVSSLALDQEWSETIVSDCTSWTRSNRGHEFVLFNFDALDKTYVIDAGSNEWHESATRDPSTDTLHRWEPNYGVDVASPAPVLGVSSSSLTFVGDRFSTKLYALSYAYTTENGNNIVRTRTTAHQHAEGKVMMFNAVRFDIEQGNGITNEDQPSFKNLRSFTIDGSNQINVGDNATLNYFSVGDTVRVQSDGTLPTGLIANTDYVVTSATKTGTDDIIELQFGGAPVVITDAGTGNHDIGLYENRFTQAPSIMFRYSLDRARTWSSTIRRKFGRTGNYLRTVEFPRLSAGRSFTVEFSISDSVHTSVLNGFIYPVVAQRGRRG